LVVVDAEGEVRWLQRTHASAQTVLPGTQRLVRIEQNTSSIYETDWLGNDLTWWNAGATIPEGAVGLDVGGVHHSVAELPNGNLATFSTQVQEVADYPLSANDRELTGTAFVRGDVIVEFTRSGEIVNEVSMFDVLDPRRIA